MYWFIFAVCILIIAILVLSRLVLKEEDLSQFETPVSPSLYPRALPSDGFKQVLTKLDEMLTPTKSGSIMKQVGILRTVLDNMGLDKEGECQLIPATASANGSVDVPGEWVVAPDSDETRRVLYIHGGAFLMGSPASHRAITRQFAERLNAAVFVPDYRLMPEHKRLDCVTDCQTAYRWILENGPNGKADLQELVVAGDSAGGNLTLTTIAWARDEGLRAADAVVAIAPVTDAFFRGSSIKTNARSDIMLKPLMGHIGKVPKDIVSLMSWQFSKVKPDNLSVSPIMGDLSNLPPILVQASECEMLLSDGVRYVNKAKSQGTPAQLQVWPHMVHVWHVFSPDLEEADEAFEEIASFVKGQRIKTDTRQSA